MKKQYDIKSLSTEEKLVLLGNLLTSLGILCISIGGSIRKVRLGELDPSEPFLNKHLWD